MACIFLYSCFFAFLDETYADSKVSVNDQKNEIKRSLESLRDLDYQTWQIIVYPSFKDSKKLTLRIVGYPGSLRIDHPTDLIVNSGISTYENNKERFIDFIDNNNMSAGADFDYVDSKLNWKSLCDYFITMTKTII